MGSISINNYVFICNEEEHKVVWKGTNTEYERLSDEEKKKGRMHSNIIFDEDVEEYSNILDTFLLMRSQDTEYSSEEIEEVNEKLLALGDKAIKASGWDKIR